jgi:hypothetical protein
MQTACVARGASGLDVVCAILESSCPSVGVRLQLRIRLFTKERTRFGTLAKNRLLAVGVMIQP